MDWPHFLTIALSAIGSIAGTWGTIVYQRMKIRADADLAKTKVEADAGIAARKVEVDAESTRATRELTAQKTENEQQLKLFDCYETITKGLVAQVSAVQLRLDLERKTNADSIQQMKAQVDSCEDKHRACEDKALAFERQLAAVVLKQGDTITRVADLEQKTNGGTAH
jgi:hypothetical protein